MTTLNAVVETAIRGVLAGAPDFGTTEHSFNTVQRIAFVNGGGVNQATALYADTRTIAASGSESLDLAGGLSDPLGSALTLTAIKAIRVRAHADNVNNVVIGGAASNAFVGPFADATDKIAIQPGGQALFVTPGAAGWPVTAGTGDLLLVANSGSGSAVTYDIEIIGEA